jgi:pimeloyl-ACP methyl ester carboxylesterase
MDAYTPAYASPGVIVVRMIRPGYADSNGNASAGIGSSRMDAFKAPNITSVAVALSNLKRHYKASKLIAVGHSDGAATAATILGRHPNIINSAVLLSCNCDLRAWKPDVTPSLSPMDWVRYVPLKTQVVSMTGSADALVPEVYASTYIKALVARLPANTKCPTADNNTLVYAGSECLVIRKFYGSPTPGLGARLVVFLHGEVFPAGSPADYMDYYAAAYASPGVVAVRMLRPSYGDSSGAKSTGDSATRLDHYTTQHIDAIANALAVLREQHKAAQLIVVGHSEGASVAATILGKYPRLIDSAMLLACPCDLRPWRPQWIYSVSPMDWAAGVPITANVMGMIGTADVTVGAPFSQNYTGALSSRGVSAPHITLAGATHFASTLLTRTDVQAWIRGMIQ